MLFRSDSQGRTVDFKNTVLILTSNIGSQALQEGMAGKEEIDERTREDVMGILRQNFRPEFLNRVDEIILFEPLRKKDIQRIVDIQVGRLQKLLADKRLTLSLSPEAEALLAERGYDPVYGARPLKRAIQKHLMDPLAKKVLGGDYPPGSHIRVGAEGSNLTFTQGAAA